MIRSNSPYRVHGTNALRKRGYGLTYGEIAAYTVPSPYEKQYVWEGVETNWE